MHLVFSFARVAANIIGAAQSCALRKSGPARGLRFFYKIAILVWLFLLLTVAHPVYSTGLYAQESSWTVTGQAVVLGPDGQSFAVAGATMELTSLAENTADAPPPVRVKTHGSGVFRFRGVMEGCYVIVGQSPELRGQSEAFCVPFSDEPHKVTVEMQIVRVVESVKVTAAAIEIDPTETSSTGSVGVSTLHDAPKANRSFEDVMPLIPGVLRGPSGEINMSGSRASQSAIELNGADVTDPVTRTNQINLPTETVSSVQVLTSPYDTQYGGFAGAISTVETKPANLSGFKISLQNFTPRPRRRNGSIMGIESSTPRFTVTGPIKKNKLAFFHSTEYQFVRADQEDANLPLLERDVEREALSIFTQVDVRHSDRNGTTGTMLTYPEKLNFFGLNAFRPQQSTADVRRRGHLATLRNNHEFRSGATLLSQLSYQDLDIDVRPLDHAPAVIGLERAGGGFFNRQSRNTIRRQWSELYRFTPLEIAGRHQLKAGLQFASEGYYGAQAFRSIRWLGIENQQVLQLNFTPPTAVRAAKNDYALFLQDKWEVTSNLTLDLGLRVDHDSLAAQVNSSYRAGFAYLVGKSGRTLLRGGVGSFFDRISLTAPTFLQLPQRTETRYEPNGQISSEDSFESRLNETIGNARSLSWSFQLDREVIPDLFLRAGYHQRQTKGSLLLEPELVVDTANLGVLRNFLTLSDHGRDHYREWQFSARYRLSEGGHFTVSYVRSSSIGDLNDLGAIYGTTPTPLIWPNQRGPLRFDVPNRFLIWSEVGIPFDLRAVPVFELRSGFPYSSFDQNRNIVGARNRAGRFPLYTTLDFQVTRRISIPINGKKRHFRAGIRIFNLLNTFNPQDVQSNIASPYYGVFYRGVKRKLRAVFELGN